MSQRGRIWTCSELARELGVYSGTVADVARVLGFPNRPHPSNGRARAITNAEAQAIRERLRKVAGKSRAPTATA